MSYSQYEEEEFIIDYFNSTGKSSGRLLEIGSYNAEVFSNSRQLIKNGWKAILIEPSPSCFEGIENFYLGDENVECLNLAIGVKDGTLDFYDSAGATATAMEEHYLKWSSIVKDYKLIKVPCITFRTFYDMFPGTYDFISIDAEGMDFSIISQIDLSVTNTKLVCIEWTYKGQEIFDYIKSFGFNLYHQNGENLIMGR